MNQLNWQTLIRWDKRDEVSSPPASSLSIMLVAASYHNADIGAIDCSLQLEQIHESSRQKLHLHVLNFFDIPGSQHPLSKVSNTSFSGSCISITFPFPLTKKDPRLIDLNTLNWWSFCLEEFKFDIFSQSTSVDFEKEVV
jgi:hypothetical protein